MSSNIPEIAEDYRLSVPDEKGGTDELLIFVSTGFVLLMQLGFAFLENGLVRKKNSHFQNYMNIGSTALEVIVWWLWGYGLAYGFDKNNDSGFAGSLASAYATSNFESIEMNQYPTWIFQFSFCGTATTIISGGLCERSTMISFLICAVLNTGFIYPIVVYWVWGGGWL